ncbi:MAG: hypothetical protein M3N53_12115 [Actinomycetota bacterium]|nr:hypothetical protein [Actinomycetota bacterium]
MILRDRSRLALLSLVATTAICVALIPGVLESADVENEGAWAFTGFGPAAAMVFALAGALLGSKRPENPVGWLFCAVGLAFAVVTAGDVYAVVPLIQGSDNDLVYVAAWFSSWSWVIFLGLLSFAILLFPSGDLPGPRWRLRARLMWAGFAAGCLAFALAPGPLNNLPSHIQNRYALPDTAATDVFVSLGTVAFVGALLTAVAGTVQRYRRSRGLQRQQMKLFAFAAATMGVSLVLAAVSGPLPTAVGNFLEIFSSLAMVSIPVAMTVAILRYRLYDIDVIVNRTLVYGVLSAILAVGYLGTVVILQTVLEPLTRESDLAVAGSTLLVAALFRPLRAKVQGFIDQRFYRRRYDAAETVRTFASRLRERVDLEALTAELVGVVGATMQPAHASVWLREPEGLRS